MRSHCHPGPASCVPTMMKTDDDDGDGDRDGDDDDDDDGDDKGSTGNIYLVT